MASRPEGDPLQCWAWGEVTEQTGERPVRILVERWERDATNIAALAQLLVRPAGLSRTVAYVPHGPLWDRTAPDSGRLLDIVLDALRAAGRAEHAIVIKLDPRATGEDEHKVLSDGLVSRGLRRARYDLQAPTTRIVTLDAEEEKRMAGWRADARRLVRRSQREGVVTTVYRDATRQEAASFHALLEESAVRGHFRARSADFLAELAKRFAEEHGWYLVLAHFDERPIAGMAIPRVAGRAYYLYGGSLKDARFKHKYGAYAAMATAMQVLAADGVRTLDMWGVVEPDDVKANPAWEGFSTFKREFGGTPLRHPGTFDLVTDRLSYLLRDVRERARERVRR